MGCFIGTGTGDYENIETQHKVLLERGPLKGHPLAVPKIVPNMASGNAAIELGIHGPTMLGTIFGTARGCPFSGPRSSRTLCWDSMFS